MTEETVEDAPDAAPVSVHQRGRSAVLAALPVLRSLDRIPLSAGAWLLLLPALMYVNAWLYLTLLVSHDALARLSEAGLDPLAAAVLVTAPAWGLTFNLVVLVAWVRTCERSVLRLAEGASMLAPELRPNRRLLLVSGTALATMGALISLSLGAEFNGHGLLDEFLGLDAGDFVRNMAITPAWLLTMGLFLAAAAPLYGGLVELARTVPARVLPSADYSAIADPMLNLLLAGGVVAAVFPFLDLVLFAGFESQAIDRLMAFMQLFALVFAFLSVGALARPVWLLQRRLQAEKDRLLGEIRGEILATIEKGGAPPEALLTQQMYVESRSSWPVSAGVQRLVFFVLLPPLGWVLAATVENLIY